MLIKTKLRIFVSLFSASSLNSEKGRFRRRRA